MAYGSLGMYFGFLLLSFRSECPCGDLRQFRTQGCGNLPQLGHIVTMPLRKEKMVSRAFKEGRSLAHLLPSFMTESREEPLA
jgi:hypothetical protein